MGVIKGTSPKTLKQQFRLTAKEQGRYKKYVAREKNKSLDRRCLLGFLHGELRQFPFTDWKTGSSVSHRLMSYFTSQVLFKSKGRRRSVSQINEEL